MDYATLDYVLDGPVARVTLSRPEVRNAFDDVLIRELTELLRHLAETRPARVLVLTGEGKAFCAGADLHWMKRMQGYSYEENLADARELTEMLRALHTLPLPTIAAVNGPAIGGGTGLVAACDIAVASERAFFSLAEVKLGLVPAAIGPYVLMKIAPGAVRELFLTGDRLPADRALAVGLVNEVVPPEDLDASVMAIVAKLLTSGPEALRTAKELLDRIPGMSLEEAGAHTADVIARLRVTPEAQEGMTAFLEKRKPDWSE